MRSLLGYSPWGCKKLDTTEQLIHTHTHTHTRTHTHTQMVHPGTDRKDAEAVCVDGKKR